MKILLTGATGLIGAKVTRVLEKDHLLYTLGRRKEQADQYFDLTAPDEQAELTLPQSDWFVHCAGIVDEDFSQNNPLLAFQKAVFGLEALLKRVVSSGVRNFIYISSSHVYGTQAGLITESSIQNPISNYAIAHYCSEQIFKKYANSVKGRLIILRPNAVYGLPNYIDSFQRWSLIPFSFPKEAKQYGKIVLKTMGNQRRNFVSTKSIATLINRIISGDLLEYQGVLNVLGAHTESVYEFALRCKKIAENNFQIECEIVRPVLNANYPEINIGNDFELKSVIAQHEPSSELDDYLKKAYELL